MNFSSCYITNNYQYIDISKQQDASLCLNVFNTPLDTLVFNNGVNNLINYTSNKHDVENHNNNKFVKLYEKIADFLKQFNFHNNPLELSHFIDNLSYHNPGYFCIIIHPNNTNDNVTILEVTIECNLIHKYTITFSSCICQNLKPPNPVPNSLPHPLNNDNTDNSEYIAPALSTFYFVTINYKEGVPYSEQIKRAQNVFKKLKAEGYYTLEQRSEDIENIRGIHTHLIIFSDKKPSKVHQYIYESVKSKVGNKKHVDVRRYNIDLLEDKLAYMKGDKWDDDKLQKVEVDKIWKQKNNIDALYRYCSQIPCNEEKLQGNDTLRCSTIEINEDTQEASAYWKSK